MAKDAKHTARPVDTRRDFVRDWPVVRVAWSMAQVRPSMENSSANSSVWRRLAWNKKDPMPRTKRDADMKSILGASNPALPGPYMYRSARWTGQGRGELLAPGTAWMGISRYTWQLRHTIGEVRQRVDKLGHVERQGVVLFAETACSSAHSNACSFWSRGAPHFARLVGGLQAPPREWASPSKRILWWPIFAVAREVRGRWSSLLVSRTCG